MAKPDDHPWTDRIGRWLFAAESVAMFASVMFLIALVVLINVEVFGRYFFGYSTLIADEYGGYLYAWIALLGGVHLLRSDRYLTMTAVISRLPPRAANRVGVFGALIGLAVCVICLISTVNMVWLSYSFGARSAQPSATPLIYPQLAMPLGYGLLALAYLEELVRRCLGLKPRRAEDDEETYGVGEIG
ncbi:TRAP transporter small permease [Bosea sp. (in: a-proteobacteria)]|uniref:TRAP transporter small permease n=1 Tax=Bosea sp. (in: a-proteobacteria) TaxID=1871050 RepID=UPI00262BB461|nr:TRAP transporter small permease [Bosea sp. (in: a-proteobacteria)]MCO5089811.1 TRAP transporter small permease [Bosea sp. (in: a-proteobacteria)]